MGTAFTWAQLPRAGAMTEDELVAATEEAIERGIIDTDHHGFVFRSQLVRETLAGRLSAPRRQRAHAALAAHLEGVYGTDAAAHAAQIAHHLTRSGSFGSRERLKRYSLAAGNAAMARYAWEDAAMHFERALGTRNGPPTTDETADLMFRLAQAKAGSGSFDQMPAAWQLLDHVFKYYLDRGDLGRLVEVVSVPLFVVPLGSDSDPASSLESALNLAPTGSRERGLILARYGWLQGIHGGDVAAANAAFDEAWQIATRLEAGDLKLHVLAGRMFVHSFLYTPDFERLCYSVIDAARAAPAPVLEAQATMFGALFAVSHGRLDEARELARRSLFLADEIGSRQARINATWVAQSAALLVGDWDACRALGHALVEGGTDADASPVLSLLALCEAQTGDRAASNAWCERLVAAGRGQPPGKSIHNLSVAGSGAVRDYVLGDERWRAEVRAAAGSIEMSPPFVFASPNFIAAVGQALVAVQERDVEAAARLYEVIKLRRGRRRRAIAPSGLVSIDRVLGLLSGVVGDVTGEHAHLAEALAFLRANGIRPELAWVLYDKGRALAARDGPGDRARARGLVLESRGLANEFGMLPLAERIAELEPKLAGARPTGLEFGLTAREMEVLAAMAAGRSDKDIAELLVISVRTVHNHVRAVMAKLGVKNRTQAAVIAQRRGLTTGASSASGEAGFGSLA